MTVAQTTKAKKKLPNANTPIPGYVKTIGLYVFVLIVCVIIAYNMHTDTLSFILGLIFVGCERHLAGMSHGFNLARANKSTRARTKKAIQVI